MVRRTAVWLIAVALAALLAAPQSLAAGTPAPLRVATKTIPPFVLTQDGKLTGFSIELWSTIANRMGRQTQFVQTPDVESLLKAVGSGKADLGIAAVSGTAERDRTYDFSQAIYDSGLQILVPAKAKHGSQIGAILRSVFSITLLQVLGLCALGVFLIANIVWFAEHKHHRGMVAKIPYFPGVFIAMWWAISTLATQADEMPKSPVGRLMAIFWMFVGVLFVSWLTATISSGLTVNQLRSDINGPQDLYGRTAGTVKASTSAEYLRERGISCVTYDTLADACHALERGDIDAVVYDSPALLYYSSHEGQGKAQIAGGVFQKEDYGIVFPGNSALRKPVNYELLKMKEDGSYDAIYTRWFGQNN